MNTTENFRTAVECGALLATIEEKQPGIFGDELIRAGGLVGAYFTALTDLLLPERFIVF